MSGDGAKPRASQRKVGAGDNYAYIVGIYKKMTRRNPRPDDTLIFSVLNEVKQDLQRAIRIGRDNSQEEALLGYLHAHLPQLMEYIAEQWSIHEGTAGSVSSEPGWEKHFEEGEYLYNFFKEKEIPEVTFTKTDSTGTDHMIPNEVVVEHIALTYGEDRASIENTLRKIDYGNGDVNHFLDHLAGAIAEKYVAFAPPTDSGDDDEWHFDWFGNNSTVEVTDPKPRAQWINIDWTRDTPHGEWKINYAWHKREKRWARGKVAPAHVIREAKRLSEVFAKRPPEEPKAGTGFGEVGLLSDKYGWVVVADPEDSEWMNILHLMKGEKKPREYGYNKAQKRWARRTVPPGDLREEIRKAGWEVK